MCFSTVHKLFVWGMQKLISGYVIANTPEVAAPPVHGANPAKLVSRTMIRAFESGFQTAEVFNDARKSRQDD